MSEHCQCHIAAVKFCFNTTWLGQHGRPLIIRPQFFVHTIEKDRQNCKLLNKLTIGSSTCTDSAICYKYKLFIVFTDGLIEDICRIADTVAVKRTLSGHYMVQKKDHDIITLNKLPITFTKLKTSIASLFLLGLFRLMVIINYFQNIYYFIENIEKPNIVFKISRMLLESSSTIILNANTNL